MTPPPRRQARPGALRRLREPEPVPVSVDSLGRPTRVAGSKVAAVREWWLVEDRWWTDRPVRRHYFELVDEAGRAVTVFREPGDRWRRHA